MALRIPSPVALTKPEAYLAYKAGILSRDELKQNLYNPLNNYEGWLAKWCELLETYPTNEDGTPQCLTDEEGLLAYLCGVTNRYPTSNSNPDDARISAYIRYLVSARYDRPDHPLNREEFYLSLIKTQFIPSGDPSSDIVIDGTTKAPFLDVKVYGDSYQQTYSGKNLFGIEDASAITQNGITISVSNDAISMNGTATTSFGVVIASLKKDIVFENGTSYTFSKETTGSVDGSWALQFRDANDATILETNPYFYPTTVSNASGTAKAIRLYIASGRKFTNYTIKIQLEKSSSVTSYEPFVGGTPAPNPDYPQPISTVTGENVVKVVGKNLFDYASASDTANTTVNSYRLFEINGLKPSTLYTMSNMSFTAPIPDTYVYFWGIPQYPGTSGSIITTGSQYTNVKQYDSNSEGKIYLAIYPSDETTWNNTIKYFENAMLVEGTETPAYEPYQGREFPIDLGTIELAKIGTYQDRIYKDGEKWYVEKNVGKTTLDGSEEYIWNYNSGTYSGFYRTVDSILTDGIAKVDDARLSKSNNFTCESTTTTWTSPGRFGFSSTWTMWFELMDNTITTYRGFNTWLSTHPTTIYYPLATPTTTEITNQTLIDQLNALKQGGAEEGTTYIKVSATDPNLPAKLYVEAPKYD